MEDNKLDQIIALLQKIETQQRSIKINIRKNREVYVLFVNRIIQLLVLTLMLGTGGYAFSRLNPEGQDKFLNKYLNNINSVILVIITGVASQQLYQSNKDKNKANEPDEDDET